MPLGFGCVGWDLGLWGGQLCHWRGVSSCLWCRLGLVYVSFGSRFFLEFVSLDGRAGSRFGGLIENCRMNIWNPIGIQLFRNCCL